ncbi:2-phospho-L-lactate transferase [Occultella kanbiaonis]|uniref:2-phospho-L-lactate transferase n=1 Tax=Occultella kanbiaonis TaxID=2675754 RepID=UPI0013D3A849|nr:2-phospho-L-lactate transferase [Occultella kanbiaonis]
MRSDNSVTVLAGGVGGAKLAEGFARLGDDLTVIVNTADDARVYGLAISPDLDTVMYTLAGIANPRTGWGIDGDTLAVLDQMRRLGQDTWFTLGDADLATHVLRTDRRSRGIPLSTVTAELAAALGVRAALVPMTDDPVATLVDTPAGRFAFQEYFVARRHADTVTALTFDGVAEASPAPGVLEGLREAAVVAIAPSNPFVSVGPILAVPGVRAALASSTAWRVAVSPVIGGAALKGPAAQMLADLGHEVSALGVARLYAGLIDAMCIDERDAGLAPAIADLGVDVIVTNTVMGDGADRERFARELLAERAR